MFVSPNLTMGTLPAPHWKGRGAPLSEGDFSIQLASNKYEVLTKNAVTSIISHPPSSLPRQGKNLSSQTTLLKNLDTWKTRSKIFKFEKFNYTPTLPHETSRHTTYINHIPHTLPQKTPTPTCPTPSSNHRDLSPLHHYLPLDIIPNCTSATTSPNPST